MLLTHIPLLFAILHTLRASPPSLSTYFALNSAQTWTVTQRERGYPEAVAPLREKPSPSILSECITHAFLSPQDTLSSAKQETKRKHNQTKTNL